MTRPTLARLSIVVASFIALVSSSSCINPSEPFPVPSLSHDDPRLQTLFSNLDDSIKNVIAQGKAPWNTTVTSFAIEVTSAKNTLWRHYHTAPELGNYTALPNSFQVDGEKAFRIASISKVFTTLAALLLEQSGKLNMRDPVTKYLPDLINGNTEGGIPWGKISLESLASQLSGIFREYGQDDFSDGLVRRIYGIEYDALAMGLPPLDEKDLPTCGINHETSKTCSRGDIINGSRKRTRVFPPNFKSSYSNVAFMLLGFVIENVTGKDYQSALDELILKPLDMQKTTVKKPDDADGVIPAMRNDWNYVAGAYDPTAGLYSTSSDLSKFLRSILNFELLDEATTNAWFKPHSWSSSLRSVFGMPWEISRTTDLLQDSDRGVSIITKAGGLPGYSLHIVLVPEFDLGFTILVAGKYEALQWLDNEVIGKVFRSVETVAREQTSENYAGLYRAYRINSSIELEVNGGSGLVVKSWSSNGTDFLAEYMFTKTGKREAGQGRVQLMPTRTRNSNGDERWRALFVPVLTEVKLPIDGCMINDVDSLMYGGKSIEELVFLFGRDGKATGIELPALRITLHKDIASVRGKGFGSLWKQFQQMLGVKRMVGVDEL